MKHEETFKASVPLLFPEGVFGPKVEKCEAVGLKALWGPADGFYTILIPMCPYQFQGRGLAWAEPGFPWCQTSQQPSKRNIL